MSHKVIVDTAAQSYFEDSLLNQNPLRNAVQTGLIIGQRSTTQDLIFTAFPTPAPENNTSSPIDEAWILEHAFQVSRMLCGGQYIMGLYIFTDTQRHTSLTGTIQHLMTQLSKQNRSSFEGHPELASLYKDLLLFQLDSTNKKTSCKLYNIEESKVNIKATEMKVRSVLSDVHLLETNWNVELNVPMIKDKVMQEQIQDKIKVESNAIMSSFALEKDQPVNNDESVVPVAAEKKNNKQGGAKKGGNKKKDDKMFSGSIPVHAISLLAVAGIVANTSSEETKPNNNNNNEDRTPGYITITGQIVGKAYVNAKESWVTAVKYLKLDLARSIQTRYELLCETLEALEQDEKKADPNTHYFNPLTRGVTHLLEHSWLMPRRVFTETNHMVFCDYLSSVDAIEDCEERFVAMLGIKANQLQEPEQFNRQVLLEAGEMMWSDKPAKKSVKKIRDVRRDELLRDIAVLDAGINDVEIVARTQLNVSQLVAEPEKQKKRTQWYMAILVLIIASIVARVFLV